jgi:hypothetical protein
MVDRHLIFLSQDHDPDRRLPQDNVLFSLIGESTEIRGLVRFHIGDSVGDLVLRASMWLKQMGFISVDAAVTALAGEEVNIILFFFGHFYPNNESTLNEPRMRRMRRMRRKWNGTAQGGNSWSWAQPRRSPTVPGPEGLRRRLVAQGVATS